MDHITYQFSGCSEYCLRAGNPLSPRRILFVPPLFDEMNRLRRTWVQAMRALTARNIASALPDLPGCNESDAVLSEQDLTAWRGAITAAADSFAATHLFSVRGGCLIDDAAHLPVMRLAPVAGASILKAMIRTRIAGDKEAGMISSAESLERDVQNRPILLAGHSIGAALWHDLLDAVPADLFGRGYEFIPDGDKSWALWRRAEPQYDPEIASALAHEIDCWSAA